MPRQDREGHRHSQTDDRQTDLQRGQPSCRSALPSHKHTLLRRSHRFLGSPEPQPSHPTCIATSASSRATAQPGLTAQG